MTWGAQVPRGLQNARAKVTTPFFTGSPGSHACQSGASFIMRAALSFGPVNYPLCAPAGACS